MKEETAKKREVVVVQTSELTNGLEEPQHEREGISCEKQGWMGCSIELVIEDDLVGVGIEDVQLARAPRLVLWLAEHFSLAKEDFGEVLEAVRLKLLLLGNDLLEEFVDVADNDEKLGRASAIALELAPLGRKIAKHDSDALLFGCGWDDRVLVLRRTRGTSGGTSSHHSLVRCRLSNRRKANEFLVEGKRVGEVRDKNAGECIHEDRLAWLGCCACTSTVNVDVVIFPAESVGARKVERVDREQRGGIDVAETHVGGLGQIGRVIGELLLALLNVLGKAQLVGRREHELWTVGTSDGEEELGLLDRVDTVDRSGTRSIDGILNDMDASHVSDVGWRSRHRDDLLIHGVGAHVGG